MRLFIPTCAALVLASSTLFPALSSTAWATPANPQLAAAITDPHREADRARDVYRHPAETLAFFRVDPGMTVLDVMPGGGWYTRVLVPYLGPQGHYIGLSSAVDDEAGPKFANEFPGKAAAWTGVPATRIAAYYGGNLPSSLDGSVDRVLIMREVHNLVHAGTFAADLDTYHRLLKVDGLLGIEEHRAKANAPDAYVDGTKGYMREADVIRMVEARGFKLVGTSEINANPKDTADYPGGVWTLPPSYALKDQDRAKYAAIGESDRMTLLFAKR